MPNESAKTDNTTADPIELIKNFKAESARKDDAIKAKLDEVTRTNAALLARLEQATAPRTPEPKAKPMNDVWYDDPTEAARRVKEEAKKEIREEFNQVSAVQAQRQADLAKLYQDYPELGDTSLPLNQRAVEIYNSFSDAEKANSMAFRLAVKDAASELGMKPKSKRTSDESFTLNGGNSNTKRPAANDGAEDEVMTIAKLMGVNTDDEKTAERLKARSKRNYGKWQSE